MISLKLHKFELPLRHPFTISRGTMSVQPTLIVELTDGQYRGFGEATTNTYYNATYEKMIAALEGVRDDLQQSWDDPVDLWSRLQPKLADNPFAACALDEAACDFWGKRRQVPVHALWGLKRDRVPQSNYTIGIDSIDGMVKKLLEVPDWPIYKIKLGTSHDVEIVTELRKHTDATFRVDANCGWSAEQTIEYSGLLKELSVEFIEQPLKADDWDGLLKVFRNSTLPIIADESCQRESDVARCAGHFHGINIKLMKCGGLTPARRMIEEARSLGLKVMVGCMTESTVGISAIAQLLPLLDYVDMDGAELLSKDIASGVQVVNGNCLYSEENGNGVRLL